MSGSAGSSRPKKQKQELTESNGAVPASKTESGDPVVGLAVHIVEMITIRQTLQPFPNIATSVASIGTEVDSCVIGGAFRKGENAARRALGGRTRNDWRSRCGPDVRPRYPAAPRVRSNLVRSRNYRRSQAQR